MGSFGCASYLKLRLCNAHCKLCKFNENLMTIGLTGFVGYLGINTAQTYQIHCKALATVAVPHRRHFDCTASHNYLNLPGFEKPYLNRIFTNNHNNNLFVVCFVSVTETIECGKRAVYSCMHTSVTAGDRGDDWVGEQVDRTKSMLKSDNCILFSCSKLIDQ